MCEGLHGSKVHNLAIVLHVNDATHYMKSVMIGSDSWAFKISSLAKVAAMCVLSASRSCSTVAVKTRPVRGGIVL